jgi:hypothetical protein
LRIVVEKERIGRIQDIDLTFIWCKSNIDLLQSLDVILDWTLGQRRKQLVRTSLGEKDMSSFVLISTGKIGDQLVN